MELVNTSELDICMINGVFTLLCLLVVSLISLVTKASLIIIMVMDTPILIAKSLVKD